MTLYASRRPWELEPHYSRHISAMTTEGLRAKHAIACELAWRDAEIARLRAALESVGSASVALTAHHIAKEALKK